MVLFKVQLFGLFDPFVSVNPTGKPDDRGLDMVDLFLS
jgi:hypothetical protein